MCLGQDLDYETSAKVQNQNSHTFHQSLGTMQIYKQVEIVGFELLSPMR